jgi:hypothetical protein
MAEEVRGHTDRIRNSPIYEERRRVSVKKAKRGSKKKTSSLVDEL